MRMFVWEGGGVYDGTVSVGESGPSLTPRLLQWAMGGCGRVSGGRAVGKHVAARLQGERR